MKLGGVPEHFNLPIHLAIEAGEFEKHNIQLEFVTFHGGTGQMNEALRNGEVDLCILLTEGVTNDIINGNPSKIISEYVTTPLCWGIHTSVKNELSNHLEIYSKQYAISRLGSGSHLMAIIDACGQNKVIEEQQFNVINHLDGAIDSLISLETDVFYWEKFTTKPYVDNGTLKRIGEFPTPWSSFVIAATNHILSYSAKEVSIVLDVIHASCQEFMISSNSKQLVAYRYGLKYEDAENWFHRTEWANNSWVSDRMIESVIYNLTLAKIQKPSAKIPEVIWKR